MPRKGQRKKNPSILSEQVYRDIAIATSLSQDQVRECFMGYRDMLTFYLTMENKPNDLEIAVPHLGTITFKHVEGKKKGDTYKIRSSFEKDAKEIIVTIEEDQPNYERIWIAPKSDLQKKLRTVREKVWRKNGNKN
jgi:hypothetical protein